MSTLNLKNIQLGDNPDPRKNFVLSVPAVADGTLSIKRQDGTNVLSIAANGKAVIPGVVGTVAQVGGLPTGQVIEPGSNANGEYVRFADGTQICTAKITYLTTSTANQSVTLPATFVNSDYSVSANVNGITSGSNGGSFVVEVTAASPTSILLKTLVHTSTTVNYLSANYQVRIICVGRWF